MNLPVFPEFSNIRDVDQLTLESYSEKLLPYSDFNFSNIWSWNIDNSFKAASLHGNLVLLQRDVKSKQFFLTIAGTEKIHECLNEIFTALELDGNLRFVSNCISLVPEETARLVDPFAFAVEEDRDFFDYIMSTYALATLQGKEFKSKRHLVNQFTTNIPVFSVTHKSLSPRVKLELLQFMSSENRRRAEVGYTPFVEYEMAALEHFFLLPENESIVVSELRVADKVIGFSIDELQRDGYALSHLFKVSSDQAYRGAYDVLNQKTASYLYERGFTFWNWVEDLGLEGLRRAKLSYRPVTFLKKYTITRYG